MFDILAFIRFYPRSSSPFSFLLSSLHIRPLFGRRPILLFGSCCLALAVKIPVPFPPLPGFLRSSPLSLRGTKSPTYRRSGLPFSNLGLSRPRGGYRDRLPFFHPGVIRQPQPEAFYGASEYAVERAGPYPHRLFSLFSSLRNPVRALFCKVLFSLCIDLSTSTGNLLPPISSLPLLRECRSGSESEQRPTDNMTCCRPIFGSPDGQPARRGADAAGRLCRRNGMNGCPCDIEEKEKSHNDGYATFVPSCFSGLCFPSSLEMRISGSR